MKKMIALVLALMFILTSVSAFADSRRYDRYTNDAFGYSVEYPASWLVLDADTVALLTAFSDIGSEIEGISTRTTDTVIRGVLYALYKKSI